MNTKVENNFISPSRTGIGSLLLGIVTSIETYKMGFVELMRDWERKF
jgi:hypothetical protein